jgi:hypothetical protein
MRSRGRPGAFALSSPGRSFGQLASALPGSGSRERVQDSLGLQLRRLAQTLEGISFEFHWPSASKDSPAGLLLVDCARARRMQHFGFANWKI